MIFVDLHKVADHLATALPPNAHVLDIGGGDGELLNSLLSLRHDLTVSMVDIAPSVGRFLEREHLSRVTFLPATPIERHVVDAAQKYDAAIVSDVMHHIPTDFREGFIRDVCLALKPNAPLFVKDIEPGHPVATLSLYSDLYISGDRGVSLVSMHELTRIVEAASPGRKSKELGLLPRNRPNYILEFSAE
ncbi:class I SAM-dependent methyltransferase [Cognatilysobacter tabacisoli]|uniref:class I SAM-dependent methyltransferase n=1 Tax=Cognatilysobacter tabacisoli TaxID=2315424 RepID=UPI001300556E|nr:class I SAM-dependent methyltransferase [Lysobacter tabacisoli]